MKNTPKVTHYIDTEEQEIIQAIEESNIQIPKTKISTKRLQQLQESAQNTINEERAAISLRIPKTDLSRIKVKAMQAGVPYQTFINSILHKEVSTK